MKFAHTNIIARNWQKLAQFYMDVFACEPIYPERDLSGEWIDKVTDIENVNIKGIHLRLPGYENGPTLEIFEFDKKPENDPEQKINAYGFRHIAFLVEDVKNVLQKFLDHGGKEYGQTVQKEIPGVGTLTVVYAQNPEGNIVEIQNWK